MADKDIYEKYLVLKNHIEELLEAVLWETYCFEAPTLAIDREVAIKIGRLYGFGDNE